MSPFFQKISFAAACFCLGSFGVAHADDAARTEKLTAPTVKVTATRTERDLSEVPMSVSVVDEKEIQRNPQLDVASQLANLPGVQIHGQTAGGGRRRVLIRGMSGARTLILIDGVRQSELRGIDGAYYNVDPANIERIEVIKGPASVLYGSEAIGGVVNIITKKGANADKPFGFTAGVTYDSSVNAFAPRGSVYGNYNGFNYRIAATGVSAGDRDTPKGELWHSAYKNQEVSGNVGYKWDKGSIDFGIDYNKSETEGIATKQDKNGYLIPARPDDPRQTASYPSTSVNEYEATRTGYTAALQLHDISAYLSKFKANAYYQQLESVSNSVPTWRHATHWVTREKISKTENNHYSYGGSAQTEWTIPGGHYVTFGLDYDRADFESHGYNYTALGALRGSKDKREGFQQSTALFLQDEWEFIKDTTLTLGVRQTWVETELSEYSSDSRMEDNAKDDRLVGSAALVYTGIENYSFRAIFSQGYRNPNLLQLFMGSGTMMLANPDLKPEKSNNFEVGARYNDGALNVDFALFHSRMKDGLSMQQVSASQYQYINFNKVKTRGMELGAEYKIQSLGLSPYGSVTWMRYETDNGGYKTTHNGQPSLWGQAGLKWEKDLAEKQTLFTDANVVMTKGAETKNSSGVITNDRPGYATVNFSIGLEGDLGDTGLEYNSTLALRNILNKYYVPVVASPMPEPGFHVVWTFGIKF